MNYNCSICFGNREVFLILGVESFVFDNYRIFEGEGMEMVYLIDDCLL